MKRAWIIVAVFLGLFLVTDWILDRDRGLTRTALPRGSQDVLVSARVRAADLHDVDNIPGYPAGVTLRWDGAWQVPSTGLYDLVVHSHGRSAWRIDGELAHEVATADQSGVNRTVWLTAGFHQIEITYDPDPSGPRLVVAAGKAGQILGGGDPSPLSSRALKPRLPRNPRLRAATTMFQFVCGAIVIVALVVAIRRSWPAVREFWRPRYADALPRLITLGRPIAWIVLASILSYGALLRVDAIGAIYGPVTSPAWLASLQTRTVLPPEAIRPASLVWQPAPLYPHADGQPTRYFSDPYLYIKAGREMRTFYGAHYREPVFSFATKVFLQLMNGQDVAVSFAATAFGILAIWSTYILGASVWSRPAGLAAALGLAIDVDDISLASTGWRDDAYIATVALTAYLMLRCWRAGNAPVRMIHVGRLRIDAAYLEAIVLGVASGLGILVRIMAASVIVPGAVWLLFTMRSSWRRRSTMVGITAVTAVLVAAPYFVNCWRVFGDPLYTFNIHGNVYSIAEGRGETSQGSAAYVVSKFKSAPVEMTDTIAQGLTTFPFRNKWHGLEPWHTGIRDWALVVSFAGLVLLAATASGRLMIFLMIMSLVPFAFTWTVDPTWRFTAHVYPALLIAAAVAISGALRGVRSLLLPGTVGQDRPTVRPGRRPWLAWSAAAMVVLATAWVISRTLPSRLFVEQLQVDGVATVTAGSRDSAFFRRGWSDVAGAGNVRTRIAIAGGVLSIPLPGPDDYDVTLRMDPFPRPLRDSAGRLPMLHISLNGIAVSTVAFQWNSERVGTYLIRLPREVTRRGDNEISLQLGNQNVNGVAPHVGLSDGSAFALWYLRIHPVAPKGGAVPSGS